MTVGLRRNLVSATVLASLFMFSVPVFAQAATPTAAAHHAVKRHARHHHRHGIPQHNGGDRDADNNGARSDGDGSI